MLTHYIKLLSRKQPVFTAINFGGLVVGITAALLLFRYVRYEKTYDTQSPHAKQIWRVFNQTLNGKAVITQDANTHSAVGPTLKAEVAGVVDYARLYCGNSPEIVVLANQNPFEIKRFYATDQGFMRMFPQKILLGNEKNCLELPYTAIITRSQAKRIFNTEDALGKTLRITNGMMVGNYTITAVIEDVPENSHLKFDLLVSYKTRYAQGHVDNFESYWDYNYFQLADGANPEIVRQKLNEINKKLLQESSIRLDIQLFTDIHLNSNLTYELEPNGSARVVNFLSVVAVLILLIAFINYINLTTALANERGKEVGVRKVLGASRMMLTKQFLIESFLLATFAFLVAVFLSNLTLNEFGQFIGRPLGTTSTKVDINFWIFSIGIVLILSFLTGLYPAFQLSGFLPSEVLKGRFSVGNVSKLRKGLVVFQFACSITLIIGVLVVKNQLNYLKEHDLGVNLNQIISIKSIPSQGRNDTLSRQKLAIFKQKASKLAGVSQSASSSIVPGLGINTISGSSRPIRWTKKNDFANITTYFVNTDEDFFKLFEVKVLAGKHQFYQDRASQFNHVSINKSMLKLLGFPSAEAAIGEQIAYQNSENNFSMTISAVIEDFHIESLKIAPNPTLYYCFSPEELNYLSLKIANNQLPNTIERLSEIWKEIYPEQPFSYWFLDENFAQQYQAETQFGKVFGLFSALAIIISCLGLLGLVAHSVQRRTKEIGIRKVLGASVPNLFMLLSKDFLILIAIALVLASPIAYFLMEAWLTDFVYRIKIDWFIFLIAFLIVFLIALLTISFQAIRAALMNPVKSLKIE